MAGGLRAARRFHFTARTDYGLYTDILRAAHGHTADKQRPIHGRATDGTRTAYGLLTDVSRTRYGLVTGIVIFLSRDACRAGGCVFVSCSFCVRSSFGRVLCGVRLVLVRVAFVRGGSQGEAKGGGLWK